MSYSRVKWQIPVVYLDDLIVYSSAKDENFDHLRTVLELLLDSHVSLKVKKGHFFQESEEFLGYLMGRGSSTSPQSARFCAMVNTPQREYFHIYAYVRRLFAG